MNQGAVIDLAKNALWITVMVSSPVLLIGLFVGLIVSIFQAVTSIQEPTLAFVPKIIAIFVAMIIFGPWMLAVMMEYIIYLYSNMNNFLV
ncbi:MAG: EscS/YscS/HrcS family type III secretion system export apparatus protein [Clostridiales bacterium GWE2_32_10]|nr:MAG: EscS/YscS/HrcS family type III secretion system export apparatus protein [Clostridiales bacterium GWE2_32_10]HBY20888.1 flagellar biosynthetic protein FliQ [Clostridiales bacterium]